MQIFRGLREEDDKRKAGERLIGGSGRQSPCRQSHRERTAGVKGIERP